MTRIFLVISNIALWFLFRLTEHSYQASRLSLKTNVNISQIHQKLNLKRCNFTHWFTLNRWLFTENTLLFILNIINNYLWVIFLLRYRCLTHLCLCLPLDIMFMHKIRLNRIDKGRKIVKIFADLVKGINLFQFSAKMKFSMAETSLTHTSQRNTSSHQPVFPADW